jgi:hypothetical protein
MLSWSSEKPIEDYTQITEDEKKSLATKLVDRIAEYFSSVQTKGLLVIGNAAISLLGVNKIRGLGATPVNRIPNHPDWEATITGTDTAGKVIFKGPSDVAITFSSPFSTPPHVVLGPISTNAVNAGITNVSETGFTISSSSGSEMYYIVIQ